MDIRPLERRDVDAYVRMIASLYEIERSPDYLIWQLFENVHPVAFYGAFIGDELVGAGGLQQRELTNGLHAGQITAINVSPDHQGRGILKRLGQAISEYAADLDLICIFSNARAIEPVKRVFAIDFLPAIEAWELPSPERVAGRALHIEPITEKTAFPDSCHGMENRIGFLSGKAFRIWRYAKSPAYDYVKLSLNKECFAVAKLFSPPSGERKLVGDIVDWQYPDMDREAVASLARGACTTLADMGATSIATWALPGTNPASACAELGFRKGFKTYFGINMLRKDKEGTDSLEHWSLKQADATNY